jgi:8-oxo-dGTP diphosphatase
VWTGHNAKRLRIATVLRFYSIPAKQVSLHVIRHEVSASRRHLVSDYDYLIIQMPQEVVAAIIIQSNKILLGHRSPDREFYPDMWDVLGGHMEPGETQTQTLVRELEEELGIQASGYEYLETVPLPGVDAGEPGAEMHLYIVTGWSGTPFNKQPYEHTSIEWFSLEEAVKLKIDPDYPALFRRYFDQLTE